MGLWAGAGTVYNVDVLAATITLSRDVPAVTREACETLGERWLLRDVPRCLRQLPRLVERLHQCGYCWLCGHTKESPSPVTGWLRVTKRALGLWKPDLPLPDRPSCPWAATRPENHTGGAMLLEAGAEGFLRPARDQDGKTVLVVVWVMSGQIYCPDRACGASWPPGQWRLLGKMLGTAAVA
jgi:hypothetical protein